MKTNITYLLIITVLVLIIGVGAYYFLVLQKKQTTNLLTPSPSPVSSLIPAAIQTPTPTPTAKDNTSVIPSGWLTYKNQKYAFEISYPNTYKALDDKDNLYGWINGVVLFYKGGQSYDLVIQAWNSEAEYKAQYKDTSILTVYKIDKYFITLLNNNKDPEVDQIILTFKKI